MLSVSPENQLPLFYIANGILSMVSDNVFVATVYINQVAQALACGKIDAEQFNHLAIAINAGTNLPSVATPNGQAAFLFLLTSALAPLIRLSYVRMMWMALPYTIVMGVAGFLCTWLVLPEVTDWFISSLYKKGQLDQITTMQFFDEKAGCFLNDIIVIRAKLTYVGRTSMEVRVDVYIEERESGQRRVINRAYFTEVQVDEKGKPVPLKYGLTPETEAEKAEWEGAKKRLEVRRQRRVEGF